MKISEKLEIYRSQNELDFIDINLDSDTPLFIDPYQLSKYDNQFAIEATKRLNSFFRYLIELLNARDYDEAFEIFAHVGEVNETCLGLSKGTPRGNGIGLENTKAIFEELKHSKAVKSRIMTGIEDFRIFVPGIDRDKISDMATNIIRDLLIEYTQKQCNLLGITLTPNIQSGFYWDYQTRIWKNKLTDMLVIDGKKYLLVPKIAVSYSDKYTSNEYYNHFVLNFLQEDNIRRNTSLVQYRKEKKGYKEPFVTKDSIRQSHEKELIGENEESMKKKWLGQFTKAYPRIFTKFKDELINKQKKVEFGENRAEIAKYLLDDLVSIEKGNKEASAYHHLMVCILEFIYFPSMCNPEKELEVNEGRKRIDIVYDNSARSGFFFDLNVKYNVPANFVIVECKNYTKDVNNPELDQLSGRFSPRKGKFGIVTCRDVNDMDTLIKRCADTYKDERGLIIPLVDSDFISILKDISEGAENDGLSILLERYRNIAFE